MEKKIAVSNYLALSEKNTFCIFTFVIISIAFLFPKSQLITGSIVNAVLFLSAFLLPKKYFLPIIIFPSLSVLSRGLIFGQFTPFLAYFLPIIWLGNFILIKSFLKLSKTGYFARILTSALLKWLVLYVSANLFFSLNLIPRMFLQTMGIYQFITACIGGLITYFIQKKLYGKLQP